MIGLNGLMHAQDTRPYTDTDVAGFSRLMTDGGVQLVDVRTPEEYADGHIAGAENIDVFSPDFIGKATKSLDKSRPVAVYCRSGRRSADAALKLSAKGYTVTNLEGGILAWEKAGEPTTTK